MLDSRSVAKSLVVPHDLAGGVFSYWLFSFLWLRRTSTRPNPDEKTGP
jgi:hypothetical protein